MSITYEELKDKFGRRSPASGQILFPIRYVVDTPTISLDVSDEISCDPRAHYSIAFLCSKCGLLWARIYGVRHWIVRISHCVDCGGGSLIDWDFHDYYILDHFADPGRKWLAEPLQNTRAKNTKSRMKQTQSQ